MQFTKEQLGRLAISSIIAVLGFVALLNSCGLIPGVVIWWLIYAIGCGVVLNTEEGEAPRILALLSLLPALIPIAMAIFFKIAGRDLCLSLPGISVLFMLPITSWFSIFIFSFARSPLAAFVKWIIEGSSEEKVKKVVTVIQLIISGVAAIALALSILGNKT